MYFVLSVNTRTNSAKIVGHVDNEDLEEAIKEVKKCAKHYVLKKNEPLLHRDAQSVTPLPKSRTVYFMSDSPEYVHQIDVYSQKTERVSGWTGTSEKSEKAKLIRRFMYSSYKVSSTIAPPPPRPVVVTETPIRVKKISPTKPLPVGGFPTSIIEDLIENGKFKSHRITAEENSKPKHTNIFESSSDSSFDSDTSET